jgi:hypothetical protein
MKPVFLIVAALLTPTLVSACTCVCKTYGDGSPMAMKHHSAAVFVGEVLDVAAPTSESMKGYFGFAVKFRVERYWKGVKTQEITVYMSLSCCGSPHPEIGNKFLVYAVGKMLETGCTRTRPLDAVADDLRALGPAKRMNSVMKQAGLKP